MFTNKYYSIKIEKEFEDEIKNEKIEFQVEETQEGITSGLAFNPVNGWGNYTQWRTGWSEQDPDLNELLDKVAEVIVDEVMWIDEIIYNMDYATIGNKHTQKIDDYTVTITEEDIEFLDDEGVEQTPSIMEIWTQNSNLEVGDIVTTCNSDFGYDGGYSCFSSDEKPYFYRLLVVYSHEIDDNPDAMSQGGSSGNYTYKYYKVLDILTLGEKTENPNSDDDEEEIYLAIIKDPKQLGLYPKEVLDGELNYHISLECGKNVKQGYIEDNQEFIQDCIEKHEVMDIHFSSGYSYQYRYGRGDHDFTVYTPDFKKVGRKTVEPDDLYDVVAVRIFKDIDDEYIFVDSNNFIKPTPYVRTVYEELKNYLDNDSEKRANIYLTAQYSDEYETIRISIGSDSRVYDMNYCSDNKNIPKLGELPDDPSIRDRIENSEVDVEMWDAPLQHEMEETPDELTYYCWKIVIGDEKVWG